MAYLTVLIPMIESQDWQTIKSNAPYLFIANGFFARLAVSDWDSGFDKLIGLSHIAQKLMRLVQSSTLQKDLTLGTSTQVALNWRTLIFRSQSMLSMLN